MLLAKLFIAAVSILVVVLVSVVVSRWLPKTGQARNQPIDWT